MEAIIRRAREGDLAALYRIVLQVADNGRDATALHRFPDIQGEVYVGPYVTLEPDLAFVLEDEEGPAGFTLAAFDSRQFEHVLEREWWPMLRRRYAGLADTQAALLPDDERLLALIRHPPIAPSAIVAEYPSHLHIDIHPRQQGKGHGRRLIETLFDALAAKNSRGVHLFVGIENRPAINFYRRIGMTELLREPGAIVMVQDFAERGDPAGTRGSR